MRKKSVVPKSTQLVAAKVAVPAPTERKRREPTRIILIRVVLKWKCRTLFQEIWLCSVPDMANRASMDADQQSLFGKRVLIEVW